MLKPAITAVAMLLGGAAVGVTVYVYVQTNPYAVTTLEPRLGAGLESVTNALREIRSAEVEPSVLTLDEITVLGVAQPHGEGEPGKFTLSRIATVFQLVGIGSPIERSKALCP